MSASGYYAGLRAKVSEAHRQAVADLVRACVAGTPIPPERQSVHVRLGASLLWLRPRAMLEEGTLLVTVARRIDGWQPLKLADLHLARALVWPDDTLVVANLLPAADEPTKLKTVLWGPLPVESAP